MSRRGYTMVELLIVIAIIVIISTIAALQLFGFRNVADLKNTVQNARGLLQEAQSASASQKLSSGWGVYFSNSTNTAPFYALYHSSYSSSTTVTRNRLPPDVCYSQGSIPQGSSTDIFFGQLSGIPSIVNTKQIVFQLASNGCGGSAIAHVQQCTNGNYSGTGVANINCTLGAQTTAGNALVVAANYNNGGVTNASISDTAGNVFTKCSVFDPPDAQGLAVFRSFNIKSNASDQITVTVSPSTNYVGLAAHEYSGLANTDNCTTGDITTQTTTPSSSVTTITDGDLIYTVVNYWTDFNPPTLVAGNGFTMRANLDTTFAQADEDAIQATAGTITPSFLAGHAGTFLMVVDAYKTLASSITKAITITPAGLIY